MSPVHKLMVGRQEQKETEREREREREREGWRKERSTECVERGQRRKGADG